MLDAQVAGLAEDLAGLIPEPFDIAGKAGAGDGSAMHTVLVQELQRYNGLLRTIRSSLHDVLAGIKGLVVMSSDLDEVYGSILNGTVPPAWLKTYPSLKPLAAWSRDLIQR